MMVNEGWIFMPPIASLQKDRVPGAGQKRYSADGMRCWRRSKYPAARRSRLSYHEKNFPSTFPVWS